MWKSIALGALVAVVAFISLWYLGFSSGEAFYLAFTIGTVAAAIGAASKKEQAVGELGAFAALILAMAIMSRYFAPSTATIVMPNGMQIEIPMSTVPWIGLGLLGFYVVGIYMGADPKRLGLWVLSIVLLPLWVTTEGVLRVLFTVVFALIGAYPLVSAPAAGGGLLAVLPIMSVERRAFQINVEYINTAYLFLLPVVLFFALDPFKVVKNKMVSDLAGVITVFLAFIDILNYAWLAA